MGRNWRILWVDDEIKGEAANQSREELKQDLRKRGIGPLEVTMLPNASDILASDALPNLRADMVIFDWRYEGAAILSGDVLEAFARRNPAVPVIIFSAVAHLIDVNAHRNVRAVVDKLDWDGLLDCIVQHLAKQLPIILHLSDLHFGSGHGHGEPFTYETLWKSIALELEGFLSDFKPNVVVVSGDLTSAAGRNEFRQAHDFLARVCQALSIPNENMLVVPGNHDVQLSEMYSYNNYFDEFVKKFYRRNRWVIGSHLWSDRRKERERSGSREMVEQDDLAWVREPSGIAATFLGLSSTTVSSLPSHRIANYPRGTLGNVRTSQINGLSRRLQHYDLARNIRIAVVHHQLFPVPSRAPGSGDDVLTDDDNRVVIGQASLLNWLSEYSVQIVLHGHSHFPAARTVATHYAARWKQSGIPIHVFGAGTTGASYTSKGFPEHYYGLISLEEKEPGELSLRQWIRVLPPSETGWKTEDSMSISLPLRHIHEREIPRVGSE